MDPFQMVVLIVAILGTIAYTSYANNVTATRRKACTRYSWK